MTEELTKFIVDKLFVYLEGKVAGVPLLPSALKELNTFVDADAVPWLIAEAKAAGINLP